MSGKKEEWEEVRYGTDNKPRAEYGWSRWSVRNNIRYGGGYVQVAHNLLERASEGTPSSQGSYSTTGLADRDGPGWSSNGCHQLC